MAGMVLELIDMERIDAGLPVAAPAGGTGDDRRGAGWTASVHRDHEPVIDLEQAPNTTAQPPEPAPPKPAPPAQTPNS